MASLTLRCPHCLQDIDLPAIVITTDMEASTALVKVDKVAAKAHVDECRTKRQLTGAPEPRAIEAAVSDGDLRGRIDRMLKMGAFVQSGASRACTMCGVNGADCLEQLRAGSSDQARAGVARKEGMGTPCCNACGSGNTHPAPKDRISCAQWAVEFHAARAADQ